MPGASTGARTDNVAGTCSDTGSHTRNRTRTPPRHDSRSDTRTDLAPSAGTARSGLTGGDRTRVSDPADTGASTAHVQDGRKAGENPLICVHSLCA